jgi:hypothetical protein
MAIDTVECNGQPDPVQTDIAPDGDVILVVGPEKARLRVHSQFLRAASNVFAAMLGPCWKEGQGLFEGREVSLMEDDADAMRTICYVIHLRNDDVPESIKPRELLQILIVSDKYNFHLALKYLIKDQLRPREEAKRVDMGYLMAAAFLLGNTKLFAAHTLALILDCEGSFLEFFNDAITIQIVPVKTFRTFSNRVWNFIKI